MQVLLRRQRDITWTPSPYIRVADDTAILAKTQEERQNIVNRLVDTGRKYNMEININKSQVMRGSRSNESLRIKIGNRELKEVHNFKYLGSFLIRDGYYTREIKMRIVIAKEAFNKIILVLTRKVNLELREKLVRCYVWSIALYGSETWT